MVRQSAVHYGRDWPSECYPKIFHSVNYQFWENFKNQLSPLWLLHRIQTKTFEPTNESADCWSAIIRVK